MAEKVWGRYFNYIPPLSMFTAPSDNIIGSIVEGLATNIAKQTDEQIYQAVLNVGFDVDRQELEKALRYDREQYKKGYADGLRNADIVHGRWVRDPLTGFTVCSYCGTPPPGDAELECFYESDYCPKCGALMDGDDNESL